MEKSGNSTSRARYYLRVLRPLFYWFIFVLILFGIRTHQRLMDRTRLYFDLTLEGREERFGMQLLNQGETPFGATAAFDGHPILTGTKIPLGYHTFTITHPKTVPFSTNLFIWYGGHNFGVIDLKRSKGTLTISSTPPAPLLFVRGPEFEVTLTNSSSIDLSVPTDQYDVTVQYPHSRWYRRVAISSGIPIPVKIDPRFGLLQLTCNQVGATYELSDATGNFVQSGDLPAAISDLPEGLYQLTSWHHNHNWKQQAFVRAGETNGVPVEFNYGAANLETTPPGATVFDSDGTQRGVTPLTLSELQPGALKFNLRLDNYEAATVMLSIASNQTNSFRTNLVSQSYAGSMRTARQYMNAGRYDEAAQSLTDALHAQPDDVAALALQRNAVGFGCIARAESLGKQANYIAAIKELTHALEVLPENERAKQMLDDFNRQAPEQRARLEREHIEAWTNTFKAFTEKITGAALVEMHEMKTSKPAKEAQTAIVEQFHSVSPEFNLTHVGWTNDVFYMDANQEVSGGGRLCMIVGAQIYDDETRIAFKVIEFKSEAIGLRILGAVLANATSTTYQSNFKPINPADEKLSVSDKNRVSEGVRIVTEKIERAIASKASP